MPASSFDFFLQDARNNFDAVRPAPIPTDANVFMGQCQNNIHVSTNCYYGFHDTKNTRNQHVSADCEMLEVADTNRTTSPHTTAKKRSADNADFPQSKRLRQGKIVSLIPWNFTKCVSLNKNNYRTFQNLIEISFRSHLVKCYCYF